MYQLIARNSQDMSESYVFHTVKTMKDALEYKRAKEFVFAESGGWVIEIICPNGDVVSDQTVIELA